MNSFTQFLQNLHEEQNAPQASAIYNGLEQLDTDTLDRVDRAVQAVDPMKVSHVLPIAPQVRKTAMGYPYGMTQVEYEMVQKVAAVEQAARYQAQLMMEKDAGRVRKSGSTPRQPVTVEPPIGPSKPFTPEITQEVSKNWEAKAAKETEAAQEAARKAHIEKLKESKQRALESRSLSSSEPKPPEAPKPTEAPKPAEIKHTTIEAPKAVEPPAPKGNIFKRMHGGLGKHLGRVGRGLAYGGAGLLGTLGAYHLATRGKESSMSFEEAIARRIGATS